MKTKILYLSFFAFLMASCGNKAEVKNEEVAKAQYECPMKCTDSLFSEPGKCSVCEMDLVEISNN